MYPKVSFVIPTLNEEKYLESCLESIKNQNYGGKIEIIISDGKSKDGTVKIAKKYTNKIVVRKSNIGQARNLGAKRAEGEFIFFVDADTILPVKTVSKVVNDLLKTEAIGATGNIIPISKNPIDKLTYRAYNAYIHASIKSNIKPHATGLFSVYRKKEFDSIGGFSKSSGVFEDFDLSERISKFGKLIFINDVNVMTSMRRIEKWGREESVMRYIKFYLRYVFTGKAFSPKEYRPVR